MKNPESSKSVTMARVPQASCFRTHSSPSMKVPGICAKCRSVDNLSGEVLLKVTSEKRLDGSGGCPRNAIAFAQLQTTQKTSETPNRKAARRFGPRLKPTLATLGPVGAPES